MRPAASRASLRNGPERPQGSPRNRSAAPAWLSLEARSTTTTAGSCSRCSGSSPVTTGSRQSVAERGSQGNPLCRPTQAWPMLSVLPSGLPGLPSSSGLGLRPFKAAARVRIPLGARPLCDPARRLGAPRRVGRHHVGGPSPPNPPRCELLLFAGLGALVFDQRLALLRGVGRACRWGGWFPWLGGLTGCRLGRGCGRGLGGRCRLRPGG